MKFFDNIVKYFSSPRGGDEGVYWVYVRCNQCGEPLRARVNLYNDLSVDYQGRKGQT